MFKLKQTILKLFLLIIIIQLANCKNKDCHKNGTCAADYRKFPLGEALNYLDAKPGSYWIYRNTASNELDTQICTAFLMDTIIKKGTRNDTKHITVEYERIRRYIQSSYNKWVYYDNTGFYNPDAIRPLETVLDRTVGSAGIISPFYFLPEINAVRGETTYRGVESNITIQSKNYQNVLKFDIDLDGQWKNSPPYTASKYYWAKDVGLIKRTALNKPDNWELIEYNIIK